MPQRKASEKGSESASMVDDLISALTDRKVIEVGGTIFEEKVESLLDIIRGLQTTVDKPVSYTHLTLPTILRV